MTAILSADPGSCSHAGGTLRSLAARLRVVGRSANQAFDRRDRARAGAPEVIARRSADPLDRAAAAVTVELDRVGSAMQALATELAESQAMVRRIVVRAEAAGLRVEGDQVVPGWGVSGVADGSAASARLGATADLQEHLDAVIGSVAQRRQRLVAALRESQAILAPHTAALRR